MPHNLCSDSSSVVSLTGALVGQLGCRNAIECRPASSSAPGILVTIHFRFCLASGFLFAFLSLSETVFLAPLPLIPSSPCLAARTILTQTGHSSPSFTPFLSPTIGLLTNLQPLIESPAQLLAVSLIFFHFIHSFSCLDSVQVKIHLFPSTSFFFL
ncbi:hypothetical protein B9Z19DRAFT_1075815 [Tuber borchii]|uniref:Uncharacterized protein n=1 Tax=Tuber borchii TaxID=42251 RepID=A0A2T7A300_TUBBO|nr:hypothetical protein B9Z19DRAFT_1075815 [Tuber borchii]